MNIIDGIIQEFQHECGVTRRVLERLPDDRWDWKPHARSFSLGQLASHIAETPSWLGVTLTTTELDISPGSYKPFVTNGHAEAVAAFDKNQQDALQVMQGYANEDLMVPWTMKMGGQTAFSLPRIAVVRSFVLNHLVHHRGQMTVYMRLNDVPVPSIYGPSADEQG